MRSYYNEVNNQNLSGFNLTQSNTNGVVDDSNYQPINCSDKVFNPHRFRLDLAAQENPIHQLGTGSADGPSNAEYQSLYFGDTVLNS